MFTILAYAASFALAYFGFATARTFVRNRLRFVPAAQSGWAPIVAGAGAVLLAAPVVALIPLIGTGTAISFGLSVGFGVANAQRDIRNNALPPVF
ncbi:MAG: hypothetical protein U5K74_12725 [Gemmatimonadaceae bacterium]|nr:hypothetical protein [Gemmatimonadaceae bacterium]